MAKDYNKLLYGKVAQEHDDFIDELKTKPPEQIIEASYEKVIKDDLRAFPRKCGLNFLRSAG